MPKCFLLMISLTLASCVSLDGNRKKTAPVISANMPLPEALEAAVAFGGDTLISVKRRLKKQRERNTAAPMLATAILANIDKWESPRLINAVTLYLDCRPEDATQVFARLVDQESTLHKQLGWHLAAMLPSQTMAAAIEFQLSEALKNDELKPNLLPKLAMALANNQLTALYSIARQGLFETHNAQFVKAMISLNRKRANYDFLDYLGLAPLEELRQLNLASIDLFAATTILRFYSVNKAPVAHPKFGNLFFYTISRNQALAELSRGVINKLLPEEKENLAFVLAGLPAWVQLSFIEGSRAHMTPVLRLFLSELRENTAQMDVIKEIDNIKL